MKAPLAGSVFALAAAALLSACASKDPLPPASATAPDAEPRAMGLRPPTTEERARLDAMAKKNPDTTPNALARERLNAERKAQGLSPLPAEPVTPSTTPGPK